MDKAEITEIRDREMRRFERNDELNQLHLFGPHQIHRRTTTHHCLCSKILSLRLIEWLIGDWVRVFSPLFRLLSLAKMMTMSPKEERLELERLKLLWFCVLLIIFLLLLIFKGKNVNKIMLGPRCSDSYNSLILDSRS